MSSGLGLVAGIILAILKMLFGLDKPATVEVNDAPTPDVLCPSDDDVMADLGMHDRSGVGGSLCDVPTGTPD